MVLIFSKIVVLFIMFNVICGVNVSSVSVSDCSNCVLVVMLWLSCIVCGINVCVFVWCRFVCMFLCIVKWLIDIMCFCFSIIIGKGSVVGLDYWG